MHLRLLLSLPVGAVLLLVAPAVSDASVGVGIQAGPVRLAGAAHAGGQYALPPVYVVNTGTEPEAITIGVERVSAGSGHTVPPAWIAVPPGPVRLSHGQSATIPLTLHVPPGAAPGRYFSDVVAHGSAALTDGGASFGVAAATALDFTVAPGPAAAGWFSVPGWLLPYVVVVIALGAAAVLIRRSGIRIRIERESARPAGGGRGQDAA